jgi:hypothetical protein
MQEPYGKGSSESILTSSLAGDIARCFLKRRQRHRWAGRFYALQRKASPGIDGVRWQEYESELGRSDHKLVILGTNKTSLRMESEDAGTSAVSLLESRFMLVAWTSVMRCLNVLPSTSSSTSRYRRVPSRVMSCPFWRVLANFERFLQAKMRCHSVRVS